MHVVIFSSDIPETFQRSLVWSTVLPEGSRDNQGKVTGVSMIDRDNPANFLIITKVIQPFHWIVDPVDDSPDQTVDRIKI